MTAPRPDPWTPEKVVSLELAKELIAAQFPVLGGLSLSPFGAGFDNTAFLVGGTWLFRFPRRKIAVPLMERECRVLPKVAPRLPLPIPMPEFIGKASEKYEWPFGGYRLIRGKSLEHFALDDAERYAIARPLGNFLKALHGLSAPEAEVLGVGPDTIGKLDVPLRIRRTHETLEKLRPRGVLDPAVEARMLAVLEAQPAFSLEARDDVLLHGDLYSRHLLLDDARQLSAIIDWGDIIHGHRATDLGGALSLFPLQAREAFFSAYGPIDAATLQLSRFRAVTHHVTIALFAAEQKDAALLKEMLGGLDRATR